MKTRNGFIPGIIILPVSVLSVNVFAADGSTTEFTLGVGIQSSARYSGSDESDYSVLPYLRIQHENYYLDSEKGMGYQYSWDNGLYAGEALGYTTGRTESNDDWRAGAEKLKGMGNIKAAINSTSTLGWSINPFLSLEGNIIAPLTDGQGMQYNTGLKFTLLDTSSDTLEISAKANFGDARFMNTYYGVNGRQSAATGFAKFNTGGGLYSYDSGLSWTHSFNENWSGYANVTYNRLTSKVKNSPVVKCSNSTDFAFGVFYTF